MPRVFIHLGLPKCASTIFQAKVFPCLIDVRYIRKRKPLDFDSEIVTKLKKYLRSDAQAATTKIKTVHSLLQSLLSVNETLFISNEGLSVMPMDIWDKTGVSPQICAERFKSLSKSLGVEICILFFSRDIASWLASRYAQSAPRMEQPCQSDFNARLEGFIDQVESHPSLAWLNHSIVEDSFRSFSFHHLELSELEKGKHGCIKSFLHSADLTFNSTAIDKIDLSKTSSRKQNQSTWVLRDSNKTITLPPESIINNLVKNISNLSTHQ